MKYEPEYNEIPLMDIRIVDNIELSRDRWITKAMDKFVSLTDNDNKCPFDIPNHDCKGKLIHDDWLKEKRPKDKLPYEESKEYGEEIVRAYDRHEPNHIFLVRRDEIERVNKKLPYPQYIIADNYGDLPKSNDMSYGGFVSKIDDYPHPSNHHMDLVDKVYENKTRYNRY